MLIYGFANYTSNSLLCKYICNLKKQTLYIKLYDERESEREKGKKINNKVPYVYESLL